MEIRSAFICTNSRGIPTNKSDISEMLPVLYDIWRLTFEAVPIKLFVKIITIIVNSLRNDKPIHGDRMIAPTTARAVSSIVKEAIETHGGTREALIPILSEINRELGYIPAEAFEEVRKQLQTSAEQVNVSKGQLFGLASFYAMLSTKPRGRHVIKFCENAPCHVVGGRAVWDALRENLDLKNGETTPDQKWTLVTTSCLGLCSVGPVVLIDDDLYGNINPSQIDDILVRYA
jgi:NADH:ubiquinone oxidoreductase subunit E